MVQHARELAGTLMPGCDVPGRSVCSVKWEAGSKRLCSKVSPHRKHSPTAWSCGVPPKRAEAAMLRLANQAAAGHSKF